MHFAGLMVALVVTIPWLASCGNGDYMTRGVSRAPVVQIVPGVAAPSAPVVTVVRKSNTPPPKPQAAPAAPVPLQ